MPLPNLLFIFTGYYGKAHQEDEIFAQHAFLITDRYETNNLIHDPRWEADRRKMVEKVATWQEMTRDIIPQFQN